MKNKCEVALNSEEATLLDKARKWCVNPVSVKNLLTARGFVSLKTNIGNSAEERTEWETKINSYREAKKTNSNIETIITSTDEGKIIDTDISAIKTKCLGFSSILNHAETFENALKNFELWCANKKE